MKPLSLANQENAHVPRQLKGYGQPVGIARGFDLATLQRIHDRLPSMLAAKGVRLEAIYFCPHGPDDGCDCRKPAPGMIRNAMHDFAIRPR